jgi:hypothetical protein
VRPEAIDVAAAFRANDVHQNLVGLPLDWKERKGRGLLVERKLRNAMIIVFHPFGYPAQIISPRFGPGVLWRGSH